MADRFSRIEQSQQLSEAYTNYIAWRSAPRTPNPNSRGAQKAKDPAYVHPFGLAFDANLFYSARHDPDTFVELNAFFSGTGGDTFNTLQSTDRSLRPRGFRAARLVWQRATDREVSTPTSTITRQQYLRYDNLQRLTLPFGKATATDDEITVFSAAKQKILTGNTTFAVSRVSLNRERVPT